MQLDHLFDADLLFRAYMGPVVPIEAGPAVRGTIHWSNFETQDRSLAVWEGWFDTSTGRATWQIYGNARDGSSEAPCCAA